eukprot:Skav214916  [mRNA]  locus=scaffold2073:51612:51890:- [translate_table: standard]
MARDGFFCRLKQNGMNDSPAEEHAKELKVFLHRVKNYPSYFEELISLYRGLEEMESPRPCRDGAPILVHAACPCPLMVQKEKKAVERRVLHL